MSTNWKFQGLQKKSKWKVILYYCTDKHTQTHTHRLFETVSPQEAAAKVKALYGGVICDFSLSSPDRHPLRAARSHAISASSFWRSQVSLWSLQELEVLVLDCWQSNKTSRMTVSLKDPLTLSKWPRKWSLQSKMSDSLCLTRQGWLNLFVARLMIDPTTKFLADNQIGLRRLPLLETLAHGSRTPKTDI